MAGDNEASAGAHERADKSVESDIASGGKARLLGRCGARLSGSVAGGQDHQVRIKPQIEDLAEGEQPVRPRPAEAGQQRRLRRALRSAGSDDAVRREVDDPELVEVVRELPGSCR